MKKEGESLKISTKLLYSIIGFLLALNIYTFAIDKIQFSYLVFYIGVLAILIFAAFIKNTKFGNEIFIALGFAVYLFFTLLYTYDFQRTFRYGLFVLVFILIHILLTKENYWHKTFYKSIFFFSIIVILGTFMSFLFPDIYRQLFFSLFDMNSQITIDKLIRAGAHTGFTNQTSANGFLISIGLGIFFSKVYTRENSNIWIKILIVFSIIALFMTMKRSFIIANIISAIILIYIKIKVENRKVNRIFKIFSTSVVLILTLILISPYVPVIQNTLVRFELTDDGIYTSGRDIIYLLGIKMFLSSPLRGVGLDTVSPFFAQNFGLNGVQQMHNIYIQLLAETGIIGFIIFVGCFIGMYVISYKVTKQGLRYGHNRVKYILSSSLYVQTLWLIYGFFGNPITEHAFLLAYLLFFSISLFYYKQFKRNKFVKDHKYE
jgi:hypothetical protein